MGDDRFFTPLRCVQNDIWVEGEDHPHPSSSRGQAMREGDGRGGLGVGDDRFFTPLRCVQNDMWVEGEGKAAPVRGVGHTACAGRSQGSPPRGKYDGGLGMGDDRFFTPLRYVQNDMGGALRCVQNDMWVEGEGILREIR